MNKGKGQKIKNFLGKAKDLGVKIAPDILQAAGKITGIDALENLASMIDNDPDIPADIKLGASEIINLERIEMEEVTKRWNADVSSDNKLSKSARPLVLHYSWAMMFVFGILLGFEGINFNLPEFYFQIMAAAWTTVNLAYFGGRELQKAIINKRKNQ